MMEEMPYVVNSLADKAIKDIPEQFNNLTVENLFKKPTGGYSGILSLIPNPENVTIYELPDKLKDYVKGSDMNKLQEAGLIDSSYDLSKTIDTDGDTIKDTAIGVMNLNDFLSVALEVLTK